MSISNQEHERRTAAMPGNDVGGLCRSRSVPIYHAVTKREWISRKCGLIRLVHFIRAAISIPNQFWVRHEQAIFFNSRGTRCHCQLNADCECTCKTAMQ
jgi:hypothetical protein